MDPYLAEMYGTGNVADNGDDAEKLAQAQFIDNLAQEEQGISYDDLTPEVVIKVASDVFGENSLINTADDAVAARPVGALEKQAAYEEAVAEQEWAEKVAEADSLGRIMAHANAQEAQMINKEAELDEALDYRAMEMLEEAGYLDKYASTASAVESAVGSASKAGGRIERGLNYLRGAAGSAGEFAAAHPKSTAGAALGATALAAGGGYAAGRHGRNKHASFDDIAEQRALEMLEDAGYLAKEAKGNAAADAAAALKRFNVRNGVAYAEEGPMHGPKNAGRIRRAAGSVGRFIKAHPKSVAGAALSAAALAGGGAYAYNKHKKASFDDIAEQRALEMLEEAGYINKEAEYVDAVDARALDMLAAAGYPVE